MNGGEERTEEGDVGALKEELKEDVGADARTCEEAPGPIGPLLRALAGSRQQRRRRF
jgi:hypothetical protein